MDRWLVVYDDADRGTLEDTARPLRHWARRIGSPLVDGALTWVPARAVKTIVGDLELCDLVLFRSKKPLPGGVFTSAIPPNLARALGSVKLEDACLAVEYTAAMPANSNALGRIGRIIDWVRAGVPTVYAVPESGYEGKDEGRGRETSSLRGLNDTVQQRRIAANQPLVIRPIDKKKFHYRELSRWLPLLTLSLSDTYSVPCSVIALPPSIKTCPPMWRHAGVELERLHQVIADTIAAGKRLDARAPVFKELRKDNEAFVAKGTRARPAPPPEWTEYIKASGAPNGARRYADGRDHYPLSVTTVKAQRVEDNARRALNRLLGKADGETPSRGLPTQWNTRGLCIRLKPPPVRWWSQKTYVCRLLLVDQCFARTSKTAKEQPWAMSSDPKDRHHIVVVELPVDSMDLWLASRDDTYVRRWVDLPDVLILGDGVFLTSLWTGGMLDKLY